MERKSYIEIKVPFSYETDCFVRLRHQFEGMSMHWQYDYFHITMAFIDKTRCVEDVKSIFLKYFTNVSPLKITFDRVPEREELDSELKEQLVIEYYSK